MAKTFFYNVNGTEFVDTVAFGDAWTQAKAQAKAEHCGIDRTVVCGEKIRYEYYDKAGIFMADTYKSAERVAIF